MAKTKAKDNDEATTSTGAGLATPSEVPDNNPVGDVDVADVPSKKHKGEVPARILVGYWVRLGEHESVPERFVGHIASVERSPWRNAPYGTAEQTVAGYRYYEDELYLVKTRDDAGALLEVPQEAFVDYGESRVDVTHHG